MYLRAHRPISPRLLPPSPVLRAGPPRSPGGQWPLPLPRLHTQPVRGHTMAYWNPWTGAPSTELMDIAERWHTEGRSFELIDEAHIRALAPSALVVELGPGLGGDLRALSNAVPFGKVVAIEQCPTVLARLSRWFAARPNVRLVQGKGLDAANLLPGRVAYLRLVRVAPYFSESELGRFFAQACALLDTQGALFITVVHPGADAHADMATGQGFGHHTLSMVLRIASWHARLRLDRLELSIKESRTRRPLRLAVVDLAQGDAGAMDDTVLALAGEHQEHEVEIEIRLWFVKEEAPPPEL